ncbi:MULTISPECIES: flagellar export chaperone FliS [Clostridium]|uniref:Flagellar secretion chaperone FliS n=1 Tax=Clostridium cadaveris TaxID=1529 RepID=A0A316M1Z6_9CLOT|nr:flagellar export chaperone FliS [Clostridium cadaveris]MDU4950816.1 flagellar export chaperone FliS [Clostridium sp.]NME63730.1 flagellar export chaperone FliS [Clostridium cadaveris]PWL52522.1 MAG: flagellar export chaperone FliS [Clostridium cadaveris]
MHCANPYNVYKQNSINMASKDSLLIMLVDATVRCTKIARKAIDDRNIPLAHKELTRVQDIYIELMATLNMDGGDFTKDLYKLYEFVKDKLYEANIKKDVAIIDEVMPIIEEIRNMWHEASKLVAAK